jgi:tRNA uridine 5-carbamoylmethylation protein Kti12
MATAHLIHGFLGAGKTTFARQLERELRAIRFSQDEWMANLNGDLFISRETFEALKARFEPLSVDEHRIDVLVNPSPILSGWHYRIA